MTSPNELTAYVVSDNGYGGCRVGFAPREHAVDPRGCLLDEMLVRLFEWYIPNRPNSQYHTHHHCNCGYVTSAIVDDMGRWMFL